jgi:organic radical activating enzyme
MSYPITEIFHSIQGEGANAGRSATFIRLAGCNLACTVTIEGKEYPCDEPLHDDANAKKQMSVADILEQVNAFGPVEVIVITGGEPTLYDLKPLTDALNSDQVTWRHEVNRLHPLTGYVRARGIAGLLGGVANGPLICMETNGTLKLRGDIDFISLSPKPARFGKGGKRIPVLDEMIEKAGEIRIVAGWDTADEVQSKIEDYFFKTSGQIFISPLTKFPGNLLIQETAEMAVELVKSNARKGIRLSLQTHKWMQIR